jgi:peptide/nickel transport system substrate-binding protein
MLRQWVRGARIRLDRNPHYFRAERPRPEQVDVLVNVDRSTQTMMFERGELDFQYYIPDADFLRFKRSPRLGTSLVAVKGSTPTFVFLNCELPPFTNRLVRVALNHAVDRDAYARALLHRSVPAHGPLPLAVRGFNEGLPAYEFNPAKARALLADAGFPEGFKTTLWTVRENATWMKLALLLQESLRNVGVIAELKEVSYAAMLESNGRRRTVPMGVWDWVSAIDDPKETLDSLLNGNNITDELCMNPAFYANPRVMQLFRDGVAEADPAKRRDIYREIERRVVEDAPWIFLVQINTEMLVQPWVMGFTPRGFWPPARLENCWIDR